MATLGPVTVDNSTILTDKNQTGMLITWAEPQAHLPTSHYIVTIDSCNYTSDNITGTSVFVVFGSDVDANVMIAITVVAYNSAGPGNGSTVTANTSVGEDRMCVCMTDVSSD